MKMTYTFISDLEADAARILGTYARVRNGFFSTHSFVILPYAYKNTVYLPDIDYTEITKAPDSYRVSDHKTKYLQHICKQIVTTSYTSSEQILRQSLETIEGKLANMLTVFFPKTIRHISHINMVLTAYGTTCSFDYKQVKKKYELYLWIRTERETQLISRFLHALVSVLVLIETGISDIQTEEWRHKEYLIDYLLHHTSLSKLFTNSDRTLSTLKINQLGDKHKKAADMFAHKLNLYKKVQLILYKNSECYLDDVKVTDLTQKEKALLQELYERRGMYVLKELLMDKLYPDSSGSEWSLTKLIQRLRIKLRRTGAYHSPIKTHRKQGYMVE